MTASQDVPVSVPHSRIGLGISIFLGGGVAAYAALKYFGPGDKQKKSVDELANQIKELKKEIEKLSEVLPSQIQELKQEIQLLQGTLSERRSKSQSNFSVYSYRTACSDEEFDEFEGVGAISSFPIEGGDGENNNAISNEEKKRAFYAQIDALYNGPDEEKETAMRILQDNEINYKDDWEFLWRLGRSHISVHEMRVLVEEKKVHANAGIEYTKRAIDIYEASSDVHKWYAIALGTMTDYVPTKEKILNGFKLKDHIKRALELNPSEPTLYFMMGRWCWGVYMLTWIERKLASTLFATPPTSTIEEALEYFLKAEELSPGFYKANQLYLGKCYYEISNYAEAKKWLESARNLKIINKDDQKSHEEVMQLLAKL